MPHWLSMALILSLAVWLLWRLICWLDSQDDRLTEAEATKNTPLEASASASWIILECRGELYPCRDIWDAIEVSRCLGEIHGLPEEETAA